LISHEYESIADKIRRSRQGLTNDLDLQPKPSTQVFVCDTRNLFDRERTSLSLSQNKLRSI
jgi:hypothetical protein